MAVHGSRRRFLESAGHGMVCFSLGGLAACGGGAGPADAGAGGSGAGGGGVGGGGTGGGTGSLSQAERAAALETVRGLVASLAGGAPDFDGAALVRGLQAMPVFSSVGQSALVGNVWARFTDGRYLVVPNNLQPRGATGSASRGATSLVTAQPMADGVKTRLAAGAFDMPAKLVAQQYRQLDMMGQVPFSSSVEAAHLCQDWVDDQTLPQLRRMALGRGFVLPDVQQAGGADNGIDNGIAGLRTVSGDGVLFITAPAAQVGSDDTPFTVICSATTASEANLARYEGDLASGLLVHAVAMRGVAGQWQAVTSLAFGAAFVAEYRWRFPTASVAVFNLSGAPSMSDWIVTLERAGVRHVMNWSRPVPWTRMLAFADDFIQFNLATNNLDGRLVRQNPAPRLASYGLGETAQHLLDRDVARNADGQVALSYLQSNVPALMVNSMLPNIEYATLNEATLEVQVVGQFGAAAAGLVLNPGANTAATASMAPALLVGTSPGPLFGEPLLSRAADPLLANGQALQSPLWEGELLTSPLRFDELARGGYLQVVNGGRCSNVVPITHWEVPVRLVSRIDELVLEVNLSLRVRADVHAWRLHPQGQPRNGATQTVLMGSVHSRADYRASGSISHMDTSSRTRTTISWSGSGGFGNAPGLTPINFSCQLMWDSRDSLLASLLLGQVGAAQYTQLKVVEQFDVNGDLLRRTEETSAVPVTLAVAGPGPDGRLLSWRFDANWELQPGQFDMLPVTSTILPAPPERQLQTRLEWPMVRPDFAPRDDFGGT